MTIDSVTSLHLVYGWTVATIDKNAAEVVGATSSEDFLVSQSWHVVRGGTVGQSDDRRYFPSVVTRWVCLPSCCCCCCCCCAVTRRTRCLFAFSFASRTSILHWIAPRLAAGNPSHAPPWLMALFSPRKKLVCVMTYCSYNAPTGADALWVCDWPVLAIASGRSSGQIFSGIERFSAL